jgi:hypothetical protein
VCRPVGLKFILRHGPFLQVVTTQEKAHQIISQIVGGDSPPVVGEAVPESFPLLPASQAWAVTTAEVVAVHTFDIEQPQQQTYQKPPYLPPQAFDQQRNSGGAYTFYNQGK